MSVVFGEDKMQKFRARELQHGLPALLTLRFVPISNCTFGHSTDACRARVGQAVCELLHDPEGQFRNAWVRHLVWGEQGEQRELAFQQVV